MRHRSSIGSVLVACVLFLVAATTIAAPIAPVSAAGDVLASPSTGRKVDDAKVAAFFDAFIEKKVRELEIPGAALVVVRDGRTVLARGYGVEDLVSGRPVDIDRSQFRAASISKLLPWILVMQLVEEGKLDLDRDVNTYLDFRIPDAFGKPVTMRHLMTHSAGFSERFRGMFEQDVSRPLGTMLRENIPNRAYAPGTGIAYSNYGAALAGYVVQRLRGKPWAEVVRERVFAPLGMHASTVAQPVPFPLSSRLVTTYHYGDPAPTPFRFTPMAPMGSLTAAPGDMGRLLSMLMAGGEGPHGRLLTPKTVAAMATLDKPLGPGLTDGFGLGLLVGRYHGVRYAGHAGNMSTLATDMEWLPDHGIGWYYVFSGQGPNEVARQVRDELLEAVIDTFAATDLVTPVARGPSSAAGMVGDYISTRRFHSGALNFSGLMNTTSVKEGPRGGLVIESSGRVTEWLPDGVDRFAERKSGIALAVSRDAAGRVERIASAALYPAAVFEPAPLLTRLVPPLGIAILVFWSIGLLASLAAWAGQRFYRAAGGDAGDVKTSARFGRAGRWLLSVCLLAWAGFGLAIAINFAWLFEMPGFVKGGLGLLAMATAPAAALLARSALLTWRHRQGALRTTAATAWAGAATVLAVLVYALDFIDLSWRW